MNDDIVNQIIYSQEEYQIKSNILNNKEKHDISIKPLKEQPTISQQTGLINVDTLVCSLCGGKEFKLKSKDDSKLCKTCGSKYMPPGVTIVSDNTTWCCCFKLSKKGRKKCKCNETCNIS
jgi:hypothetical protein